MAQEEFRTITKSFERLIKKSKQPTKPFKSLVKYSKKVTKLFEWLIKILNGVSKPNFVCLSELPAGRLRIEWTTQLLVSFAAVVGVL